MAKFGIILTSLEEAFLLAIRTLLLFRMFIFLFVCWLWIPHPTIDSEITELRLRELCTLFKFFTSFIYMNLGFICLLQVIYYFKISYLQLIELTHCLLYRPRKQTQMVNSTRPCRSLKIQLNYFFSLLLCHITPDNRIGVLFNCWSYLAVYLLGVQTLLVL